MSAKENAQTSLSRLDLGGLFALVLLGHLAVAALVPSAGSFGKYALAARLLAKGQMASERLIDFSPLYLELHRLALPLEGIFGPLERFLPWVQIVLLAWAVTAASAAASYHLGRRLAFAFALLLAFDTHLLIYVRILEPEILLLTLLATWLFLFERDVLLKRHLLLAGLAAALAVATRPTFLPVFLLVVPLHLGLREGFRPWRGWLARASLFVLPILLCSALLSWRAALATGDFRSPAMNPGTVFFEGHQPLSTGISARYPPIVSLGVRSDSEAAPDVGHVLYRRVARLERGEPRLAISKVNEFWAGKALAFLSDHPRLALERAATQLRYSAHAFSFHDVPSAMLLEQRLSVLPLLPFSVLAAFALWGALMVFFRHRMPQYLLFFTILGAQLGVMTLFYVSARQRLLLLPAIVLFALIAGQDLRLRGRRGWLLLVVLLLLAFALAVRNPVQNDELYLRSSYSAALEERSTIAKGLAAEISSADLASEMCEASALVPSRLDDTRPADYPQDEESLEDCIARRLRQRLGSAPAWLQPSLEFDLAWLELERGNLDEAEALLLPLAEARKRFLRSGAEPSDPQFYLARIDFRRGHVEAAKARLAAASKMAPGEPFLLADLLVLGDESAREQILRNYSELDLQWIYGRALLFYGRPGPALEPLMDVVHFLPNSRRARLELAIALAELSRDDEAFEQLRRADFEQPEPLARASRLLPLFERLAKKTLSPRERLELGVYFFRYGSYHRAAELLATAIDELGPQCPPEARQLLELARK